MSTADLVLVGGTVVNAAGRRAATVVIREGLIAAVLDPSAEVPAASRVLDATGQLLLPGGVDPHCHVGQVLGEFSMLDGYEQATIAALWGGTTTIIDFAIPEPRQPPLEALHGKLRLVDSARCDVALHGAVLAWDSTTATQLQAMSELGVLTVKMFTTYRDGVMADPSTIAKVMAELGRLGGMALIHAEANHLVEASLDHASASGRSHARFHAETRPEEAELAAVMQALELAEAAGCSVYFVHQTTDSAVALVADARARGIRAYSETCPHYLTLDDSLYDGPHPELYVCCPPLRSSEQTAALTRRAQAGDIDTIGSDHNCYSTEQKRRYADDATRMPNGFPGVEHRLVVAYDHLVVRNGMRVEDLVSMTSTAPAELNGLQGKGRIAPGADADLVVLDPGGRTTITAASQHTASDYTPFEGRVAEGRILAVVAGGRIVVDETGFHDPGAVGRRIPARARLEGTRRLSLAEAVDARPVGALP
ncbi:amidohydrolase family protein [Rathayibacter sp. Leaf296]|uniref:amidohydrolase family protein n=1 Tax=Rathayibacter sp. Leaf296 TaxID=1736327 RepID=UPI000703A6B5|nr:amidohydrolase family protein [Rathayibacter sp. Leaf296]KQQ08234.1 dihydropyrimidinase [Rathayibacter sp. Leaf296]